MNPSALCSQSLNSLFAGQLTLFVGFCFPTRRSQGIATAAILISVSVLLLLCCQLFQIDSVWQVIWTVSGKILGTICVSAHKPSIFLNDTNYFFPVLH